MPGCENIQFASGYAHVTVAPLDVTSITASPGDIHQFGIDHYKATVTPGHSPPPLTWEYQSIGSSTWLPINTSATEFDFTEETLGTFNVRASLTSGGVVSSMQTTVTVIPRPIGSTEVDYLDHWAADDQTIVWADGTLSVQHPAAGEKTSQQSATITLKLEQAPGTDSDDFSEIKDFSFTLAGHNAGQAWRNITLDQPLTSDNAPDPTYTVSFTVPVGGSGSPFSFELYAETPTGSDLWSSTTLGPSLKHGTLWKIAGTISWVVDANGVYTSIGVGGVSGDQAHGLVLPTQHIPIRSVDHP